MNIISTRVISIFTIIFTLLFSEVVIAEEFTSFASFYRESSSIGWGIAAVAAIVSAVAIYFSAGTATPLVASMGTWVGTMMGYSGIAATNAGLALLGGGSIAGGGLGIAGGTALLSAALTFGGGVAIDYSVNSAMEDYKYDYSQFADLSKKMTTLPLPKNTSGPDLYKEAIEVLETTNTDLPPKNSLPMVT